MKTTFPEVRTTSKALLSGFVLQYEWYDFSENVYQNPLAVFPNIHSGLHFYFPISSEDPDSPSPPFIEYFSCRKDPPSLKGVGTLPNAPFKLFRVVFLPAAVECLLPPLTGKEDGMEALTDPIMDEWRQAAEGLKKTMNFRSCIGLFESFLLRKISLEDLKVSRVLQAVNRSYNSLSEMRVQELANDLGISRRHLNRCFHDALGISIKQYLRILRFQLLLEYLISTRDKHFIQATHLFGFYDQSHLCNEFKRLADMSPGSFYHKADRIFINPRPGQYFNSALLLEKETFSKESFGYVSFLQD